MEFNYEVECVKLAGKVLAGGDMKNLKVKKDELVDSKWR